jgi:hypothetical protein
VASSHHKAWWIVLVCGLLVATAHALAYRNLFHGTCIDDAYISFRYVTNLADGNGLVFNPGEHVEGYSNFLWILMLTPFATFMTDLSNAASWLGLALALASLIVAAWSLRHVLAVMSPWAHAWMLLLVAGSGYFVAWSISGMETGLVALLLTSAWARATWEEQHAPGRFPLSALLFAALALARPDGVVLCVVALAHRFLKRRDVPFWRFAALLVGVLVVYHAWRFSWFGVQWFPNSVEAKTGGGWSQLLRGLRYLTGNFLFPYLPLLSILLLLRNRSALPGSRLGVLLVASYLAVFTAAGGDWSWGRFFGPVLPLASLLFVAMVSRALSSAAVSRRRAWIVVAALWTVFAADLTSRQRTWQQWSTYAAADRERVALGKWMRENLPRDTRLAAFAIGQLAYYSGFVTHDMLGITDRHIASLDMPGMGRGVPGHEKYDIAYTLGVVKPDVIVGAELMPGMSSSGLFMSQYQTVNGFWTHHNVAMQKDFLRRAVQKRARP